MDNNSFHFEGTYRVQSAKTPYPSKLSGTWFLPTSCLNAEQLNKYLAGHARWRGKARVTLRPALIEERTGAFASHADALYYRRLFNAAADLPEMENDVLDLSKLASHWVTRERFLRRLLPAEEYKILISKIRAVEQTATNEYMCHEAGHCLGLDINKKWGEGYFQPRGGVAWPLIYVEEFRADLESFKAALDLLTPANACAVFVYHFCHRLGLACESAQTECENAGAVPYLLFHLLRELEILEIRKNGGRECVYFNDLTVEGITSAMRACAAHATESLTEPEMSAESLVDAALVAATYYRTRALDQARLNEFWRLVSTA